MISTQYPQESTREDVVQRHSLDVSTNLSMFIEKASIDEILTMDTIYRYKYRTLTHNFDYQQGKEL